MDPLRSTVSGAYFLQLIPKNNFHGRVNTLINSSLLFNQRHVVNHFLMPIMCLMRLEDTNNPRINRVIYYVYKTDKNM